MSRISILNRSIRTAAIVVAFAGLLSPANAAHQLDAISVFPDLPVSATADHARAKGANSVVARNASLGLTSHRPWLAPVGHRQPHQADVPHGDDVSTWERQQQQLDHELDGKLSICRGC